MDQCGLCLRVLVCWMVGVFFSFTPLEATTTQEVFAKYPNKYFIESGSFKGDGIMMALEEGFEKIYSIELSSYYFQLCCDRFAQYPNITILEGDSGKILPTVLNQLDAPATFWLDGHYAGVAHAARGDTLCPILLELEDIRQHSIKTHTILIDDVRMFGTVHFDFITLEEVIKKIEEINPNYMITYEDGVCKNDVLVAFIPTH